MPGDTTDRIRRHLVGLKMPRALEALQMTLSRIEQGEVSALEAIESLLGEEYTTRESRRIKMALQTARLPTVKTLSGYDFSFQPSLDRNRVLALAELEFVARQAVRASARAARHGQDPPGDRARRGGGARRQERLHGHAGRDGGLDAPRRARGAPHRAGALPGRHSLLIVDEIGYLPVGSGGGNLFFQLVNACYERCAMIMTSNRGFGEWGEIFGDSVVATALLDRLLHHAVVIPIEGNSYRLREHADLLPEHLRGRSLRKKRPIDEIKRRPGRPRKEAAAPPPAEHRNRYRVGKFTPAELGKSSPVLTRAAEPAVGGGLHLRLDLAGLVVRGLRHRRVRPAHRGLAGQFSSCAPLVLDALEQALYARQPGANGMIHHSTAARNTSPSATASAWPRPASNRRWAAPATATTTPWPRRSTGCTRPR